MRRHASVYHAKVRAFEFAISLAELLPMLKVYTAVYLWKYRKTPDKRMGLFQHLLEVALSDNPNSGRPPRIWVERTQAMYLPAWLIDASVVATAERITSSGVEPALATVASQSSYFPGFSSEPLSCMALGADLEDSVAVPFSDKLRQQFGQEITCVPFMLAPFSLFSLWRLAGVMSITKNFRMDISSARANMMAAYPVLVPVYLVEFRVNTGGETESYTVVCQAATLWSPYVIDDYIGLLARDPAIARKPLHPFLPSPFLKGLRAMLSFANLTCKVTSNTATGIALSVSPRGVSAGLSYLINSLGTMRGATRAYEDMFFRRRDDPPGSGLSKPIDIDWDDLRIRPFTAEERRHNRLWTQLDAQVQRFRWFAANGKVAKDKLPPVILQMAQSSRDMHEDARPEWLRQWHARPNKKDDGFT
ncbi:hypothetical protein FOMPIDRAFT_1055039 [Fomitopsis schrenkii]|uniref:Uncharacterized protein n=1 Tax=Fomitopsis schrenkii TaxID=2126942 RepID=S8EY15_FOMSC|nr:hypothetical protein FOMPIDRAFT_1055039 [Fomitopsis schrenkii]